MSRVISTTLYAFAELNDKAKAKARDWYRTGQNEDASWSECTTDDFLEVAKLLGFTIQNDRDRGRRAIWWSGFSSQGDGACFEGDWSAKRLNVPGLLGYAPQDNELHAICAALAEVAHAYPNATATLNHTGRYYHSGTVSIDCEMGDPPDTLKAEDEAAWISNFDEGDIRGNARRLMDWLYRTLDREYTWINEDAQVDEALEGGAYEFTVDGKAHS